jgi:hypothetical protein
VSLGTYTQSAEKRRLSGMIEQRGTQTGLPTPVMFLFGLPFAGIGTVVSLVGLRRIPVKPSSVHGPYWLLIAFGLVFALGGIMVWGMAWKQFQANRRRALAREHHADEPALEDYNWDPRGFHCNCWAEAVKAISAAGFYVIFLSIFNWWAWFAGGPVMVKAIVSLFDLILIFVCGRAFLTISRAVKFGNSRIEFVRFPYRAADPITVRWLTPPRINRAAKGTFTLRCVKEWYEATGTGSNRSNYIVHEEQWSGTWSLDHAEDFPSGKNIDLEFQPPADAPVTSLSGKQTVFWEFEVNLSLPGPDFKEAYLVPVY